MPTMGLLRSLGLERYEAAFRENDSDVNTNADLGSCVFCSLDIALAQT
jgi:hypothetical protein